ncbi:MAG: c-type cytochrome [Blastocatellia bacterium]
MIRLPRLVLFLIFLSCFLNFFVATAQIDVVRGEKMYLTQCAMCHGPKGEGGVGEGGRGPVLAKPKLARAPDEDTLKAIIRGGIAGTGMPGTRLVDAELRDLAAYVRKLGQVPVVTLPGDARRGAALYQRDCAGCHTIDGHGGAFGPDLTGIGASRSPQHLRESLVNPVADFPRDYAFVRVVTRDGKTLTGVRVNEDTFSIQFRDVKGTLHSFWKNELRTFSKDLRKSLMPSYRALLSAAELDDLVALLASLQDTK